MKYLIRTSTGGFRSTRTAKAVPKAKVPDYARGYHWFTHKGIGSMKGFWQMSEWSTGRKITKERHKTRTSAISEGAMRLRTETARRLAAMVKKFKRPELTDSGRANGSRLHA